jgi:hypothetical protein
MVEQSLINERQTISGESSFSPELLLAIKAEELNRLSAKCFFIAGVSSCLLFVLQTLRLFVWPQDSTTITPRGADLIEAGLVLTIGAIALFAALGIGARLIKLKVTADIKASAKTDDSSLPGDSSEKKSLVN